MTTGEKLALFRKGKGMTQEALAETLSVSRQSVSRWEMDAAFPETDKLIKLSKLFDCSIDFLLNESMQESGQNNMELSVKNCYQFICECGYFFLATSVDDKPRLRPFGMIYSNDTFLFIATDKRKSVYSDLQKNPNMEMACHNPNTHKWIRISGKVEREGSQLIKEEMMRMYPNLARVYHGEEEMFLVIYRILIDDIRIS